MAVLRKMKVKRFLFTNDGNKIKEMYFFNKYLPVYKYLLSCSDLAKSLSNDEEVQQVHFGDQIGSSSSSKSIYFSLII